MAGVRAVRSRRGTQQAVRCRLATLGDFERINALERRYRLGFRSYDEWSHMWVNNPVCKRAPNLPIGWVLEDPDGGIVGSIGSVPFGFEIQGREFIAGTSSAWVTEDGYRAYAPLLLERFLSQPDVDLHLGISPNGEAQPAVALHSQRVPVGVWDRAAFWVTNCWGFVESALEKRQVRFRSILRYPAWAAMVVHRSLKRDALRAAMRRRGRYEVATCTAFDLRFDELWQALRAAHPERLLFTRSREVLEWHFRYPFARKLAWISSVSDGDRLVAYAVFCRKDVSAIGLRRVRLIDYQSVDETDLPLMLILAETIDQCRRDGTAVLETIGWRLERGDLMARIAPYSRRLPSWQYFYSTSNPALLAMLKEPSAWNPMQYEGDPCI